MSAHPGDHPSSAGPHHVPTPVWRIHGTTQPMPSSATLEVGEGRTLPWRAGTWLPQRHVPVQGHTCHRPSAGAAPSSAGCSSPSCLTRGHQTLPATRHWTFTCPRHGCDPHPRLAVPGNAEAWMWCPAWRWPSAAACTWRAETTQSPEEQYPSRSNCCMQGSGGIHVYPQPSAWPL